MPPTVTTIVQQASPLSVSPGLGTAPSQPAPHPAPLGTTYYQYVPYSDEETGMENVIGSDTGVPYASYSCGQNAYPVTVQQHVTPAYTVPPPGYSVSVAGSSAGSSPAPPHIPEQLHTPPSSMHSTQPVDIPQPSHSPHVMSMVHRFDNLSMSGGSVQFTPPQYSPASSTQWSPGPPPEQPSPYQHQPPPPMTFVVPAAPVLPGNLPPTQMLHVQIPMSGGPPQGFTMYGQPLAQASSYPAPPSSDPTAPLPLPVPATRHSSVTTNLEVVWHSEFDRLFKTLNPNHKWYLVPSMQPPEDFKGRSFKDSAKVRFCCKCGNGWTSMKGRVMFWFVLDTNVNVGFVYFRLYGQRCSKCDNEEFVHAMWYPEEVTKVVNNIYMRVGQVHYNFYQPPLCLERRSGKPRQQHNSKLCQACAEGVCREGFMTG